MYRLNTATFQAWVSLAQQNQRPELRREIANEMRLTDFTRGPATVWAYHRIASYLEDEWREASSYWDARPGFRGQELQIGQIINRLVAGYRYDRDQAKASEAHWLFADETADLAAFVFYVTTKRPRVVA